MKPVLYTISGAPRGWRVLLGLVFKGIEFDVNYLSLANDDHKSDSFLELSPRGRVPAMVYGDLVITDSLGILSWLDQEFPTKPLFGSTPKEHAEIWSITRDTTDHLRTALRDLLTPIFFQGEDQATDELKRAAASMVFELQGLESRLDGREFMAGDGPTAADAVAYPEIGILARALKTHGSLMVELGFVDLQQRFPLTHAWAHQIEEIKGFAKTIPVHWNS